jgi:hypothetical protein
MLVIFQLCYGYTPGVIDDPDLEALLESRAQGLRERLQRLTESSEFDSHESDEASHIEEALELQHIRNQVDVDSKPELLEFGFLDVAPDTTTLATTMVSGVGDTTDASGNASARHGHAPPPQVYLGPVTYITPSPDPPEVTTPLPPGKTCIVLIS